MSRRKLPPDTRLDWRDPEMPVIRDYKFRDGTKMPVVEPEYERRFHEHLLSTTYNPRWRDDPTYNMKRKR